MEDQDKLDRVLEAQANIEDQLQVINATLLSLPQGIAEAFADRKNDKKDEDNSTDNRVEVGNEDNNPYQG